jgi:hypothetical protein
MTDTDRMIEQVKAEMPPFESWERLNGEGAMAYAAFCVYRDYGPERNVRKAAVRYADSLEFDGIGGGGTEQRQGSKPSNSGQTVEKRYRVWRRWAGQFRWRERAADYDRYLDRLKQAEKRKTIEAREAVYRETTKKMLQVVNKKLDLMDPAELTQGNVTEWMTRAISTEREIAGPVGADGKPEVKQGEINFSPEFNGL